MILEETWKTGHQLASYFVLFLKKNPVTIHIPKYLRRGSNFKKGEGNAFFKKIYTPDVFPEQEQNSCIRRKNSGIRRKKTHVSGEKKLMYQEQNSWIRSKILYPKHYLLFFAYHVVIEQKISFTKL